MEQENRLIHTCHAAAVPFPYLSPAMPCRVNSHMPCRALRESPRGSRKYPNCLSYSLTDWYASYNNLRGTPRGSRKKPKAGRLPTCRLWTADDNSQMPCHAHAALCRGLEKSFLERLGRDMARARHGRGIACVNQIRPHCVNQMGKTQSKPLAVRHGRGIAWARHGNGMVSVT
jgi:hypothetical protein